MAIIHRRELLRPLVVVRLGLVPAEPGQVGHLTSMLEPGSSFPPGRLGSRLASAAIKPSVMVALGAYELLWGMRETKLKKLQFLPKLTTLTV